MKHELKTWTKYFEAVFNGKKNFELRKDDRGFQIGDILILKEWEPELGKYTGRQLTKSVTYIFEGGSLGLEKGFVIMAIS